jgi:hypothetical protein
MCSIIRCGKPQRSLAVDRKPGPPSSKRRDLTATAKRPPLIGNIGPESHRASQEGELAALVRDQPVNAIETRALDDAVVSRGVLDQPVAGVAVQGIPARRSSHGEGLVNALG